MPLPAEIATISPVATANTGLFLPVEACLNPTVAVQQQTAKSELASWSEQGEDLGFLLQKIVNAFDILLRELGVMEALEPSVGQVDLRHRTTAER